MSKVIIRRPNGRNRVYQQLDPNLPSLTDQSQKDECDVNNIIRRFTKTKQITHLNQRRGVFADSTMFSDLLSATIQVREANEAFSLLPSELRKKLNNDPTNLLSYLNDPKNHKEAYNYGLLSKIPGIDPQGIDPETNPKGALVKNKTQKSQNKGTINDDSNDE